MRVLARTRDMITNGSQKSGWKLLPTTVCQKFTITVRPLKIRDIFSSFKSHILKFKRLSLLVDRRFVKIKRLFTKNRAGILTAILELFLRWLMSRRCCFFSSLVLLEHTTCTNKFGNLTLEVEFVCHIEEGRRQKINC